MSSQHAAHSPGPWEVHGEHHYNASIHGANKICTMTVPSGFYRSPAESEANARLIAAVPDILQQLRALAHLASVINSRQHAGLKITPAMWSELDRECQDARTVIEHATAEGGRP